MDNFSGATFCFLGRSGCGKDTQAQLLKEYVEKQGHEIVWISTGELGRNLKKQDTVVGRRIKNILETGGLFSDWLAIGLWFCMIKDVLKKEEVVFFPSSPRYLKECEAIDQLMSGEYRITPIPIYLNITDEEALKRMLARGRADDTSKVIAERLSWFDGQMLPMANYYGKRLVTIDGHGSIEEVHKKIINAIKNKI